MTRTIEIIVSPSGRTMIETNGDTDPRTEGVSGEHRPEHNARQRACLHRAARVELMVQTCQQRVLGAGVANLQDHPQRGGRVASHHFVRRWASRAKPATLQLLMQHRSIETTLKYYVDQDADDVADELWRAFPNLGKSSGKSRRKSPHSEGTGSVDPSPETI
jgi:hypothetical protein